MWYTLILLPLHMEMRKQRHREVKSLAQNHTVVILNVVRDPEDKKGIYVIQLKCNLKPYVSPIAESKHVYSQKGLNLPEMNSALSWQLCSISGAVPDFQKHLERANSPSTHMSGHFCLNTSCGKDV